MPRGIVTLLTDFGYRDAYVGVMKGVIASRCDARLIDLTHGVEPGDIASAAYLLGTAWAYFPDASVHVAVVDPGVGSERAVLAAEHQGHQFVAPDNGLLTDVLASRGTARPTVVRVTRSDLFLPNVSRTFHGRDVFAPVAAALANGTPLIELGDRVESYVTLDRRTARRVDAEIAGEVIYIDRFGNLVTNITGEQVRELGERVTIHLRDRWITGVSESYAAAGAGALMAIIGSSGRLEVSISGGDAATELEVALGEPVRVNAGG